MTQQTLLEKEIMNCAYLDRRSSTDPNRCRPWNEGRGWPEDQEFVIWDVRDGMSLTFDGISVPFWCEIVPCPTHLEALGKAHA